MVSEVHWRIFIFVATLVLSSTVMLGTSPTFAQQIPYIGVYPSHITNAKASDTFTVRINVSSTVLFVGYQFYLYWNRAYLNATSLTEAPPAAWTPFYAGTGLQWNYNSTHSRIERAALDTHTPLIAVTGNFTVATICFSVLVDVPPQMIVSLYLKPLYTFLANADGDEIKPYYVYDDDVHLIGNIVDQNTPNQDIPKTNVTTNTPSIPINIDDPIPYNLAYITDDLGQLYAKSSVEERNTSSANIATLIGSIPILIILFAAVITVVIVVTLTISLVYIHDMNEQDKKRLTKL